MPSKSLSAENVLQERLDGIKQRNFSLKHKRNSTWPVEKRIEVVTQYLVLGNLKQVAALTGVSYDLVRQWKTQQWWPDLEKEIRASQNLEVDGKLTRIVDKSLDVIMDRLEGGDYIYDQKLSRIIRKPVNMRDAISASKELLTKRELLRENADGRKETTKVSMEETLKLLATEFAKWIPQNTKPQQEIVDVEAKEVNNAFHEEWEEGLQEGTPVGAHEETGESEGSSGEEFSSFDDGESRESTQG